MAESTADRPASPEALRASDAERDHAVSELRNEFAEGRLSHDTFMYRMQSALDARHRGQLAGLFTDLPPRRPGLLARIKAVLRGGPPARQEQPDGLPPGTQRIREVPGPGPQGFPGARPGPAGPMGSVSPAGPAAPRLAAPPPGTARPSGA